MKKNLTILRFQRILILSFLYAPILRMMISVSFVSTSSLTWSNDIPYPITVLYPTAMTGQDNCIYVFGGLENNKSVLSESYKFNNSGGNEREWISITSMPNGVAAATGCLSNDGRIFIFGGVENWKSVTISSSIQIYNPTDDTWNTIIPTTSSSGINIEDYWMSCAVSSKTGLMYLTGGYKEGTRFYSYDVNSNTITDFYSSTTPFNLYSQGTFVTNDEKLYIFGGASGSGFTLIVYNSTYIYDISTSTLTNGNAMETAACYFGYVTDGSRFYIIGGYNENQYLQNTQVYTIVTGEWSTDNGIIYEGGIYGNAATLLNGTLHSIGGANSTDERTTGGVFISNQLKASLCGIYTFNGTCENEDRCSITNICNTKGECISNTIISCPSCKTCNSTTGECEITSQNCNSSSTSSTNSTSSTSRLSIGKIIGILISILALVTIIAAIIFFILKYKRRKQSKERNAVWAVNPYVLKWSKLKIQNKIGEGSFGIVYLGVLNGTEVAIKTLLNMNATEDDINGLLAEATIMKNLPPHPNVVLFRGITLPPDPLSIVTDFCEEGSLYEYLEKNPSLPISEKIHFIRDIAKGMSHLHYGIPGTEVIHRDLAARNVLLKKRIAIITDFGMSRVKLTTEASKRTQQTVGPLKWMSPESLFENKYSTKSDVFSFGVVIYEIITQEEPWKELNPVQAVKEIAEGRRLVISRKFVCPDALRSLMERCLSTNPDDRPDFHKICNYLAHMTNEGTMKP